MAINPTSVLAAGIAGGPTAAKEAETNTAIQPDVVQQALSSVARNSGAIDAPAAFQAAQAHAVAAPLTADVAAGHTVAGAQSAYQQALAGSHNDYMNGPAGVNGADTQAAVARAIQMQLVGYNGVEQKAMRDIAQQQYYDNRMEKSQETASTSKATAEVKNRVQGAQQDAAADPGVTPGSLVALRKVLSSATDVNTASKLFDADYTIDPKSGAISDAQGNIINQDDKGNVDAGAAAKIYSYLHQAFAPDGESAAPAPGQQTVLNPGTPEYAAFMAKYANTQADGNYIAGQ